MEATTSPQNPQGLPKEQKSSSPLHPSKHLAGISAITQMQKCFWFLQALQFYFPYGLPRGEMGTGFTLLTLFLKPHLGSHWFHFSEVQQTRAKKERKRNEKKNNRMKKEKRKKRKKKGSSVTQCNSPRHCSKQQQIWQLSSSYGHPDGPFRWKPLMASPPLHLSCGHKDCRFHSARSENCCFAAEM